jgi:FkbM family methyltransferase
MAHHFLDIGANSGNTFGLFLNNNPKYHGSTVWCFEPSPQHFNALLMNARIASNLYQVIVCPFGVGGKTELLPFYEMVNNTVSDSLFKDVGGTIDPNPRYQILASVVSISDFISKFIPEGDTITMKVDCEGAEYDIYESLIQNPHLLNKIECIYNEWHPGWDGMDNSRKQRILSIVTRLAEHGKVLKDWAF